MTKKRQILFSVIRGLLAILIALLVATLLIFLSADGSSFSEKLSAFGIMFLLRQDEVSMT